MDNIQYIKIQKTKLTELINSISKQLFSEDKNFILNLRKLCEGLTYFHFDEKTNYANINKSDKEREGEVKHFSKDEIIKDLADVASEISKYLHYNNSDIEYIEKEKIKEYIKKVNVIMNKNNFNLPSISYDHIPSKILLKNDKNTITEYNIKDIIGRTYEIPMYQRRFSWDDTRIKELANNILIKGDDDLGIFYLTENNELVDGQQRIHSLYIIDQILFTFFNDKLSGGISEKKLFIQRKRNLSNWRGDFDLFSTEIKKANDPSSGIYSIYKEIEKIILDCKEPSIILSNWNGVYANVKKIRSSDGIKYFKKINDQGQELNNFEKLFSSWLNENQNLNDHYDKLLFNSWDSLDEKYFVLDNEKKDFIDGFFKYERKKIESLKNDILFKIIDNFIKIFTENKNQYFIFRNGKNIIWKERNQEYFDLLYDEIKIRVETNDEQEAERKIIWKLFFDSKEASIDNLKFEKYNMNYLFSILEKYYDKYSFSNIDYNIVNELNRINEIDDSYLIDVNKKEIEFIENIKKPEYNGFFEINGNALITKGDDRQYNGNNILPLIIYMIIAEFLISFVKNESKTIEEEYVELANVIIKNNKNELENRINTLTQYQPMSNDEKQILTIKAFEEFISRYSSFRVFSIMENGHLNITTKNYKNFDIKDKEILNLDILTENEFLK